MQSKLNGVLLAVNCGIPWQQFSVTCENLFANWCDI